MNPNAKSQMTPFTLKDFQTQYPNDATCLEWLRNYLYPNGIHCVRCGRATKHHRDAKRQSYSCDYCGNHVHPTANTIFHKSATPLSTWFYAIYLMSSTRCGISAKQIQRETGVTYKTAWRMFKQIRSMLVDSASIIGGSEGHGVEMDETYIGGKRHTGRRGRPATGEGNKTCVVGAVERKGRVVAIASTDATRRTLHGIAKERILPKTTVYTDELNAYQGLDKINGYQHRRINHSAGVYVLGDTHTNTIEGFWSLVKRGISGVYHSVSRKYLQSYLDEYSFRYNRRFDTQPMFTSVLQQVHKYESCG